MTKRVLMQEEILCNAMFAAKKAFNKHLSKHSMEEFFDLDITGYCYDDRGNMTFKVAMEAQDGIDNDDLYDIDDEDAGDYDEQ
jgi:hypothetical protein